MRTAFACLVMALFLSPIAAVAADSPFVAVITKVEGDGVAKVRRKSGIQSVAGEKQKLFPGDRVTTDAKSTVEMLLPDGTLVRVGLNTDYRVVSVAKKKGFLSWVFDLTKGSLRALVEKGVNKRQVKFRVNTPVGTMGVRGTELVLVHDPKTAVTTLYTIEGLVEFGEKKCPAKRNCIEVKTGETASVGGGRAGKPTAKPFSNGELLGMDSKGEGEKAKGAKGRIDAAKDPGSVLSRAALFESPKDAERLALNSAEGVNAVSKGDVDALVKKASEAMANAQDQMIGRTKAEREAIHHAIQDGTLGSRLKLAEKFDDVKSGKKDTAAEREQENLSATRMMDKFKLADAILNSKKLRSSLLKRHLPNAEDLLQKIDAAEKRLQEVKSEAAAAADPQPAESADGTPTSTSTSTSAATIDTTDTEPGADEVAGAIEAVGGAGDVSGAIDQVTAAVNPELVDGLIDDPEVDYDYEYYISDIEKCGWWEPRFICEHDVYKNGDWYDVHHDLNKTKRTTSTERKSGKCYETVKRCGKELTPCDLSKGKFCKPTLGDYECHSEVKEVDCPR